MGGGGRGDVAGAVAAQPGFAAVGDTSVGVAHSVHHRCLEDHRPATYKRVIAVCLLHPVRVRAIVTSLT